MQSSSIEQNAQESQSQPLQPATVENDATRSEVVSPPAAAHDSAEIHAALTIASRGPPSQKHRELILQWLQGVDHGEPEEERIRAWTVEGLIDGSFDKSDVFHLLSGASVQRTQSVLMVYGIQNFEDVLQLASVAYKDPNARDNILSLIIAVMLESSTETEQPVSTTPMALLVSSTFINCLIDSLLYDTGNRLFPLGLRTILLVLPYAPLALTRLAPLLMVILGRALCWRVRPFADADEPQKETTTRTPAPLASKGWHVQTSAMEVASTLPPTLAPDVIVRSYLNALYGAWPSNIIAFIRDPGSYLDSKNIPPAYEALWGDVFETGLLARRIDPLLQDFRLHPTIIYFHSAAELADSKRWEKLEPSEIISRAETLAKVNSNDSEPTLLWDQSDLEGASDPSGAASQHIALMNELRYSERARTQYTSHNRRLQLQAFRMDNDAAEINHLINRLKEQDKTIVGLTADVAQFRSEATQAQQRHVRRQDQLRDKLAAFRSEKQAWQRESASLRQELEEFRATAWRQKEELAHVKNERFKLRAQLTEYDPKIQHIEDYEVRMKQLTEMQRLWDQDVRDKTRAEATLETWKARYYELSARMRSSETFRQNQTLDTKSRTIPQVSILPGATRITKETPSQRQPDMDFYVNVADNAKRRVEQLERDNLNLHAELERLQLQGAVSPSSQAASTTSDVW